MAAYVRKFGLVQNTRKGVAGLIYGHAKFLMQFIAKQNFVISAKQTHIQSYEFQPAHIQYYDSLPYLISTAVKASGKEAASKVLPQNVIVKVKIVA